MARKLTYSKMERRHRIKESILGAFVLVLYIALFWLCLLLFA